LSYNFFFCLILKVKKVITLNRLSQKKIFKIFCKFMSVSHKIVFHKDSFGFFMNRLQIIFTRKSLGFPNALNSSLQKSFGFFVNRTVFRKENLWIHRYLL
jgi:hypothetical protein